MAELFDNIKQSMTQAPAPAAPKGQQTANVLSVMRASTGRAPAAGGLGGPTPKATTIQENIATAQATSDLGLQQQQGQTASMDLAQKADAQQQEFEQKKQQLKSEELNHKLESTSKTTALMSEFDRERDKLSLEQQTAAFASIQSQVALANDKYVFEIQDVGRRTRLDEANNQDEALAQAVFKSDLDFLKNKIDYTTLFDEQSNAFELELARLNGQDAWDAYRNGAEQANKRAVVTAIGSLASTGAQYGAEKSADSNREETYNRTGQQERTGLSYEDSQTLKG